MLDEDVPVYGVPRLLVLLLLLPLMLLLFGVTVTSMHGRCSSLGEAALPSKPFLPIASHR